MITKKIKNQIIQNCKKVYPNEACGFIIEKNNQIHVIECQNIAEDKINNFMISALDFLKIKTISNKILFLYHNHIQNREFSILDKQTADTLRVNLLLYINNINLFRIYYFNEFKNLNYLFKEYNKNENNCFHLVKNYFKNELGIRLNIEESLFKNREVTLQDMNKIIDANYEKNNLIKKDRNETLKLNDILVLKNKLSTHLGVYVGCNKILHQPLNRISIIEDFTSEYNSQLQYILRSRFINDKG